MARLSALAIAVATSLVKEASCASVSAGSGSSPWWLNATAMQPHSRLSTLTGTPIRERSPQSLGGDLADHAGDLAISMSGRPVWYTSVFTFRPPSGSRPPTGVGAGAPVLVQVPTTSSVSCGS